MTHSLLYERAKLLYDSGYWNKDQLKVFVLLGKLTEEEYKEITGEDY